MDESIPAEYYRSLGQWTVSERMRDFDNPEDYEELARAIMSARSRNFVLDFDDDHAWCGLDLTPEAIAALLKNERPPELNTRWINIWLPHDQKDILETVAKHYDFTPRLLGFMQSLPLKQPRSATNSTKTSLASYFHRSKSSPGSPASSEKPLNHDSPVNSILDPGLSSRELIGMVDSSGASTRSDMDENLNNPYFLANEIWHYSSVDWGRRYLCIGYNTIHNIPSKGRTEPTDAEPHFEDRPSGKRVWNWLILCEDRTVISISEDPYPTRNGLLTHKQQLSLSIIRRNLHNTFRQLSKARDNSNDPAQMRLPLRTRLGDSEEEAIHRATDIPGMLFYYLFDDWLNTYSLIARREHYYARELNKLRVQMLNRAVLSNVEKLHHIGRQLGVLKRVYQSYEMIIDRVLEKQEPTLASLKNSKVISGMQSMEASHAMRTPAHLDENQILGVAISSAARARFERLKSSIRLYALSEINECIEQKDSLVMMNFNLIAIKEAFSVEKLTEVTLLLAKITIVFMPVSLMSAYFGAQFTDAKFTTASYWKWFSGIFVASCIAVAIHGFVSGTSQSEILVRPLGMKMREKLQELMRKKRVHDVEDDEKMF